MWRASDWEFTKDPAHAAGPMWMDDIHVQAIYRICCACGFRHVLEVGCFDGFSTSGIVQAKIEGHIGRLTCVDREIRPALMRVLGKARDNWIAWQDNGADVISECSTCDLVVIDSDHDMATTQREWAAFGVNDFVTLIAHDVGSKGGCPGPQWLLQEIGNDGAWHILVDEKPREGMRTDRGLMFATLSLRVFVQASRVWPEGRAVAR